MEWFVQQRADIPRADPALVSAAQVFWQRHVGRSTNNKRTTLFNNPVPRFQRLDSVQNQFTSRHTHCRLALACCRTRGRRVR